MLTLRDAAPRRPGKAIYHSAGRDVEELNRAKTPRTVSAYMALEGRGHAKFFDADRWFKMQYEGS